jgi:hypothetical protein
MEDNLKKNENGRQPQKKWKWKTTSILVWKASQKKWKTTSKKIEDDLKNDGRWPKKWKEMEDDLKNNTKWKMTPSMVKKCCGHNSPPPFLRKVS